MIARGGIVDLSRRWLECLVYDLEQNDYHISFIKIFL